MAAGDATALTRLMDRHLAGIKMAALMIVRDHMIAEDIAQETFIKAWTKAAQWQPGKAKYATWLYRVAKNGALDRVRKKGAVYMDQVPEVSDDTPNAAEMLEHTEIEQDMRAAVSAAILQLPPRQALAIRLAHFDGHSQMAGAEILELSVSAYESLLARARRKLRTILEDQVGGPSQWT